MPAVPLLSALPLLAVLVTAAYLYKVVWVDGRPARERAAERDDIRMVIESPDSTPEERRAAALRLFADYDGPHV